MAIKKQYLKTKPLAKVTLSLPAEAAPDAQEVKVAGDFTNWKPSRKMRKLKNGEFKLTVDLPVDKSYQFRYLIDGNKWENDWSADDYVNNGVSYEDNSVITL
ncbi:MAG: isoamylase early set domain-containing protein [Fulvivirga sp.]|nr:isoamylase early set domain-containing protein [Fulvivirga sp.]